MRVLSAGNRSLRGQWSVPTTRNLSAGNMPYPTGYPSHGSTFSRAEFIQGNGASRPGGRYPQVGSHASNRHSSVPPMNVLSAGKRPYPMERPSHEGTVCRAKVIRSNGASRPGKRHPQVTLHASHGRESTVGVCMTGRRALHAV